MESILLKRETDRKKVAQWIMEAQMGAMQPPEFGKGKESVLPRSL